MAQDAYQQALAWFREGKYTDVLKALPAPGATAASHNLRSLALLELRRYDEALEANRLACQVEPGNANYQYNAGLIWMNQGNPSEAEAVLRQAVLRFPSSSRLRIGLGEALLGQDRLREAEAELKKAAELEPGSATAQVSLAKLFYALGDGENLAVVTAKALSLDPRNFLACFYRGKYLLEMKGEPAEGAALIRKSIELAPRFVDGLTAWAGLMVQQERWDEAIRAYQQALAVDGKNRQLYYLLAVAYRRSGQPEKADSTMAAFKERSRP